MIGGVLDLGELVKRAIKYLVEGALALPLTPSPSAALASVSVPTSSASPATCSRFKVF